MKLRSLFFVLTFAFFLPEFNCQSWSSHYGSSSEYLHSNDTMKLVLSQTKKNALHGAPNDRVTLEFILVNQGMAGHFTLQAKSEDGFMGVMSTRDTYLGPGVQQTITISNMVVPARKEGAKVRFTLMATRDSGFAKREAPPTGGQGGHSGHGVGGSGSYPGGSGVGGSGSYPGGSGVGGSGSYPGGSGVGGSGSYPGGSGVGGSGSYPGGQGSYPGGQGSYPGGSGVGGSGSYPGGDTGIGGSGGGGFYDPSMDPSNRRDVSLTVEFTVTNEVLEDDTEPWSKLEYMADYEEQTCKTSPGQPGCENEYWGVKFFVQDKESGLHLINVDPIGREPIGKKIYFRYINFPIGSVQEHEIIAVASCCTQGMKLRATDVAGVEAIQEAEYKGTGSSGLSTTAFWGIIGGVAAFVIIIIVVIVVIVCRKKYTAVSQNP